MCGWQVTGTHIDDMAFMMILAPVLIKLNVCGKNTFCKMVYEKKRSCV
jgi:hypothetical protein